MEALTKHILWTGKSGDLAAVGEGMRDVCDGKAKEKELVYTVDGKDRDMNILI